MSRVVLSTSVVVALLCSLPNRVVGDDSADKAGKTAVPKPADSQTGGTSRKQRRPGKQPQDARRQRFLQKYDANKNGRLDPDERRQARRDALQKRSSPAGRINPMQALLLKQFDKNKDGKLDASEQSEARKTLLKRRQEMFKRLRKRFSRRGGKGRGRGARGGRGRRGGARRGGRNNPLQKIMQLRKRFIQQQLQRRKELIQQKRQKQR